MLGMLHTINILLASSSFYFSSTHRMCFPSPAGASAICSLFTLHGCSAKQNAARSSHVAWCIWKAQLGAQATCWCIGGGLQHLAASSAPNGGGDEDGGIMLSSRCHRAQRSSLHCPSRGPTTHAWRALNPQAAFR